MGADAVSFLLSPFGRVSRRGLWLGYVLGLVLLLAGAYFADRALTHGEPFVLPSFLEPLQWALDLVGGPFVLAIVVLMPWVNTVMVLKRLHDRGFSGFVLVWKFVALCVFCWLALTAHTFMAPPNGIIVESVASVVALLMVLRLLIIVLFLAGQDGANRFGEDPLRRR